MATIWNSTNKAETNHTFSGTARPPHQARTAPPPQNGKSSRSGDPGPAGDPDSSWSRPQKLAQQELATSAGFLILGLLLVLSACSKQSLKPALAGVSCPAAATSSTTKPAETVATQAAHPIAQAPAVPATTAKVKKALKKRPANVTYSDLNSGLSFVYPRKFALASGDKAQSGFAGMDSVPMNFAQPGGVAAATVSLPATLYPGTDFAAGFFSVNVNRSLSEQECPHFAFVDTSDADGEPIDAQKVKVGAADMEMTSEFAGSATKQLETQYYHHYENGACYEYVLGLGTAGYGAKEGIEPVNRDEVFARLEKILGTVKTHPVAQEQLAAQPVVATGFAK